MRAFSIPGAGYYCSNFQTVASVANESLEDFDEQQPDNIRIINEGTALFDEYRARGLRDAERNLFLATSHYRRALDLMVPSSCHWAHVTLYYGAWFAAHSLLGMFGCQILRQYIIEVERSTPGNQQLRRHKIGNKQNQHNFVRSGSHQRFWEGFYATVPHISPFADPRFAQTMAPIAGNEMWLVEQRNRINYKVFDTIDFRNSFVTSFSSRSFPSSLPGELNTQYSVCEGLLLISLSFASRFQLSTDALDSMGPKASFRDKVRRNIYWPGAPELVSHTQGQQVFGI